MRRAGQIIPYQIHGDAQEPRRQFRLTAKCRQGPVGFYECLLGKLFRVGGVANVSQNEVVEAPLLLFYQSREVLCINSRDCLTRHITPGIQSTKEARLQIGSPWPIEMFITTGWRDCSGPDILTPHCELYLAIILPPRST